MGLSFWGLTHLVSLAFQTIFRNAASGYGVYIAYAGTFRQMATPPAIEIALAFTHMY
jgi:hypothetical protein